jgi:hypothetical protein
LNTVESISTAAGRAVAGGVGVVVVAVIVIPSLSAVP